MRKNYKTAIAIGLTSALFGCGSSPEQKEVAAPVQNAPTTEKYPGKPPVENDLSVKTYKLRSIDGCNLDKAVNK